VCRISSDSKAARRIEGLLDLDLDVESQVLERERALPTGKPKTLPSQRASQGFLSSARKQPGRTRRNVSVAWGARRTTA
jgi:hypothetical protein